MFTKPPGKTGKQIAVLRNRLNQEYLRRKGGTGIHSPDDNGHAIRYETDGTSGSYGYSAITFQPIEEDTNYPGFALNLAAPGTTETDREVSIHMRDGDDTEAFGISVTPNDDNVYLDIQGSGVITFRDNAGATAFIVTQAGPRFNVSTANVSNPPTDAELDSEFGTPATVGTGFTAYVDDNGAGSNFYL